MSSDARKYWQRELRNGTPMAQYAAEFKQLTDQDKADLDAYAELEMAQS